jgi:hypothetical protein
VGKSEGSDTSDTMAVRPPTKNPRSHRSKGPGLMCCTETRHSTAPPIVSINSKRFRVRRLQHDAGPLAGDVGLAVLILALAVLLFVVKATKRWARTKITATPRTATTEELIATLLGRFQTP